MRKEDQKTHFDLDAWSWLDQLKNILKTLDRWGVIVATLDALLSLRYLGVRIELDLPN